MPHDPPHGTPPPPPPANRYLDWTLRTGFRYQRPGSWVPLLVEFRRKAIVGGGPEAGVNAFEEFQKLGWLEDKWRPFVKIPEIFAVSKLPKALSARSDEFDFCVVLVDREQARNVIHSKRWQAAIRNAELGPPVGTSGKLFPLPSTESSSSQTVPSVVTEAIATAAPAGQQRSKACHKRVVIAVLDEGIAFAHERFRSGDASRVEFLWKQDGRWGTPLLPWLPGTELTAAAITGGIKDHSAAGRVDEDRLYQREGDVDFGRDGFKALARSRAHGTHVLDLAAGRHRDAAGPDMRPIIAVELPEASVADPTGAKLYAHIIMGIFYILWRADSMRKPQEADLPIVVSLSYGPHHGPHDGSSTFERIIDLLINILHKSAIPLHVVIAAGNFRQLRTHARVAQLPAAKTQALVWVLQPEDRTPSFLELWAQTPDGSTASLEVTVVSPRGLAWKVNGTVTSDPAPTAPLRELQVDYVEDSGRTLVTIVAQPTADEPLDPLGLPLAAPGRWTIKVENTGECALEINMWIGRDIAIGGRRARGRQSYFDDPAYVRLDREGCAVEFDPSPAVPVQLGVERARTLSGIATGDRTHVVGGFRRKPRAPDMPSSYTSMGPTARTTPYRDAVTALAPSDDSLICTGLLGSGTRSGSVLAMTGSSVAAPVYARALANEIGESSAMVFDPPPTIPPPPFVPPAIEKDVAGKGCLRGSPYHDSETIRGQRP